MKTFDLVVIGSGAGLNIAVAAAEQGLKVALIEKGPLGGTCLNRGCIPSKMIIHSADLVEDIKRSSQFGILSKVKKINLKQITDRATNLITNDSQNLEKALKKGKNPSLFQGTAKFTDKYILKVNGEKIRGKKIVIAAGARPVIPKLDGLEHVPYLTSTEALRLTKLPKSLIIIGGGYIAAELGHFYGALGCKITVIQRSPLLLSLEDLEISQKFTQIWRKKHQVFTNASLLKVAPKRKKVFVYFQQGKETKQIKAEKLLIATGIQPNSDLLAVKKTGVQVNERGFILVNQFLETNKRNIWALGDIIGKYMFRHSANLEAESLLNNLFQKKKTVDYFPMPHAIFSSPQIAGVGITEQEAKEKKINYAIAKYFYKDTGMGEALAEEDGFVKFILDAKRKKILGCHILGPHASILIQEVLVAMKAGNEVELLRNITHIHPALSEVVQKAL